MFDNYDYESIPGRDTGRDLRLFALSTCGFCRRAIAYLEALGISYRRVYVDLIPFETKTKIRKEFFGAFQVEMYYPALIVDEKEYLVGYVPADWEKQFKTWGFDEKRNGEKS